MRVHIPMTHANDAGQAFARIKEKAAEWKRSWEGCPRIAVVIAGGRRSTVAMSAQAGAMLGIDTYYVSWRLSDFVNIPNGTCRPILMHLNVKSWDEWMTVIKVVKELCAVPDYPEAVQAAPAAPAPAVPPAEAAEAAADTADDDATNATDGCLFGHSSAKKKLQELTTRSTELAEFVSKEKVRYIQLMLEVAIDICDLCTGALNANFNEAKTAGEHAIARLGQYTKNTDPTGIYLKLEDPEGRRPHVTTHTSRAASCHGPPGTDV